MTRPPRLPPLLALTMAAMCAWLIDRFAPMGGVASGAPPWGAVVAGLGLVVSGAGVHAFRRARTTVDPLHPDRASALVASGIYRITRNPMYVGFALMLAGWVLALGTVAGLGVLVAFVIYLDRLQIPPEEAALRARFGSSFDAYASRVRRWL